MRVNDAGLKLIRAAEGFRGRAYRDAVGIWTIGYGHTSMAGPPAVHEGLTITAEAGEKILARDVENFARGVEGALTVTLNDNEFSALVSFAYNVGLGNFRKSSVLKAANAGDREAVARRLQLWVKAGGKTLPGLVKRRAAEAQLFQLQPEPQPQPKGNIMTSEQIAGIVRAIIAAAGGYFVSRGVADAATITAVAGAAATLAAAVWSVFSKKLA
jgi:GH24 family phage-related lysozyme (muramidase)